MFVLLLLPQVDYLVVEDFKSSYELFLPLARAKTCLLLLLLPQVTYFVAKDYLVAIDYLATKNYFIVFEDIVAFAKKLVLQAILDYHPSQEN
jgi:hypothetical protein